MLIALITASKAVEIHHLNIENMVQSKNQFFFKYKQLHKDWKKRKVLHYCEAGTLEEKRNYSKPLSLLTKKLLIRPFLYRLKTV